MALTLRVLILEDRQADADLMLRELRGSGFEPQWQRVETESGYLDCLDQGWDVILADYSLPAFDALGALRRLQERGLDIPFIVVTGSIGEEAAVECMKQGAADYLLKDRLTRLGQSVRLAVEAKRLRDEKRQAEAEIGNLAEFPAENRNPVLRVARDGTILYANPASAPFLDLWRCQVGHVLPEDTRQLVLEALRLGVTNEIELACGRRVFSIQCAPIAKGECVNLYGRDITARVQVQDALVRRTHQLETVHALTLEILEEKDLSALLTLITRRAVDLVGASSGTIYLWDEAGQVLVPRAWHGLGDRVQAIRVRPGEAVVGRVVEGRQGMIVNDYQTSESTQSLILEHGRFTAVLAEPLLYRDRLVGVFGINHEEAGKRFSEEDRTLLNLFAAQAAIAIENVRLHAETIRRLTEMTALYEVGRATASSMDLDKRLEAVLTLLTHAMGAQRAMVGLVDDTQSDRCQLRLGYDQARPNPWLRHLDLSMDRYPEVQAAVRTQQPILIPNASRALLLTPVRDHLEQVGLRSLLVVPLLVQGRAIGAISLGYVGEARSFTDQEIRFCQSMADFSAAVIANARLFEQVSRAKAEWEHTFHSIRDLVAIIDTENRFVRVNRALAERFGTAPDDLVGQHCHAVFHGTETPWLGCPHLEALAEGKSTIREIEDPRLGETFLVTCSPLRDVKGNLLGTVHIAREITEQKRLEAESRQRQQFEDLSRAKSAFIANMSHELRTPLNSVIGFAELLLGQGVGPLTEKQARYLGHVQSSGKHLLKLISDILDLSKIEVGKIELQLDALAVSTTLDDILVIAHGLTHKKNQTIHAEVSPDLPLLRADPVRFKQILFNLLSNAVKFTPNGGTITVRAYQEAGGRRQKAEGGKQKAEGGEQQAADASVLPSAGCLLPSGEKLPTADCLLPSLVIEVTDTGVGIKPDDMPKLFQEFVQLETTRAQKHEGTGLGLALTRRLVELHGGKIWAHSDGEGCGSTFTVLLPFGGPEGSGQ